VKDKASTEGKSKASQVGAQETEDQKAARLLPILASALDHKMVTFATVATARFVNRGFIKMSEETVASSQYLYPKLVDALAESTGVMVEFYWAPDCVAAAALLDKRRSLLGTRRRPDRTLSTVCNPSEPAGARMLTADLDKAVNDATRFLFRRTRNEALELAYGAYTHILGDINAFAKTMLTKQSSANDVAPKEPGGGSGPADVSRTTPAAQNDPDRPRTENPETLAYLTARVKGVRDYVDQEAKRAAENIYLLGAFMGFVLVVALAISLAILEPNASFAGLKVTEFEAPTIAGALGAMLSIMLRMSNASLSVDWKAGRTAVLITGLFRPLIGALSAFIVFLFVKTGLVSIAGTGPSQSDAFFLALGFIAGFGERWVPDMLSTTTKSIGDKRTPPSGGSATQLNQGTRN
jgi:hypothetical protein